MKTKPPRSIMVFVKKLGRTVFTTHEIVILSGRSRSTVTQCLTRLMDQGLLIKVCRGVWAEPGQRILSPLQTIPYLFPRSRVYVSFISALHLHGIVEQIPQVITLAALSHTRTLHTEAGVFSVHQMAPSFFDGFGWYKGNGSFLIAEPEKALVDCLYLSSRKKKQFGYFPELHFPPEFSFKKTRYWIDRIPQKEIRLYVLRNLEELQEQPGKGQVKPTRRARASQSGRSEDAFIEMYSDERMKEFLAEDHREAASIKAARKSTGTIK